MLPKYLEHASRSWIQTQHYDYVLDLGDWLVRGTAGSVYVILGWALPTDRGFGTVLLLVKSRCFLCVYMRQYCVLLQWLEASSECWFMATVLHIGGLNEPSGEADFTLSRGLHPVVEVWEQQRHQVWSRGCPENRHWNTQTLSASPLCVGGCVFVCVCVCVSVCVCVCVCLCVYSQDNGILYYSAFPNYVIWLES